MGHKIVNRQIFSEDLKRVDINAPLIAAKVKAGQFVRIRPKEGAEYASLAVFDADAARGIISLIAHKTGAAVRRLGEMSIGDSVFSVLGPLGVPVKIEKRGTVICIATGLGIAQILPIARALKKEGNKVVGIIGANTKKELLLEAQMRLACSQIFIATDDGSHERRGLATDIFRRLVLDQEPRCVYTSGGVDMVEMVCSLTKERNIKTYAVIYPVMVDCLGLCGACRVRINGKTVLACVEGPVFDGHTIDFGDLHIRINAFKEQGLWDSRKSSSSRKKDEERTSAKFLSDIPRS